MNTTTTTTEEFTFPILVSATRASIDSPPLWRQAGPTQTASTSSNSTTSSSSSEEEEEGREHLHSSSTYTNVKHNTLQRKRFSGVEEGATGHRRLIETEEDDIMDLLWEDFNEELPKNRNSFVCNPATTSDDDHGGILELGCVPNNLSKGVSGGGARAVIAKNKKLKVVVLSKALKKLFLLQHQSVKKRSW